MSDYGKTLYRVKLLETDKKQKVYYFGSLSAIYDVLDESDIGCKLTNLWQFKVEENAPYRNRKCEISKGTIIRKKKKETLKSEKT